MILWVSRLSETWVIGVDAGIGTVDSGVGSGYFLCNPSTPSLPLEFLGVGEVEQFDVMKPTGVPSEAPSDDSFTVEDAKRKQVEELDFSRGILMPDSCTTQLHELSKLDWMEPRPPGRFNHHHLEFAFYLEHVVHDWVVFLFLLRFYCRDIVQSRGTQVG